MPRNVERCATGPRTRDGTWAGGGGAGATRGSVRVPLPVQESSGGVGGKSKVRYGWKSWGREDEVMGEEEWREEMGGGFSLDEGPRLSEGLRVQTFLELFGKQLSTASYLKVCLSLQWRSVQPFVSLPSSLMLRARARSLVPLSSPLSLSLVSLLHSSLSHFALISHLSLSPSLPSSLPPSLPPPSLPYISDIRKQLDSRAPTSSSRALQSLGCLPRRCGECTSCRISLISSTFRCAWRARDIPG